MGIHVAPHAAVPRAEAAAAAEARTLVTIALAAPVAPAFWVHRATSHPGGIHVPERVVVAVSVGAAGGGQWVQT